MGMGDTTSNHEASYAFIDLGEAFISPHQGLIEVEFSFTNAIASAKIAEDLLKHIQETTQAITSKGNFKYDFKVYEKFLMSEHKIIKSLEQSILEFYDPNHVRKKRSTVTTTTTLTTTTTSATTTAPTASTTEY